MKDGVWFGNCCKRSPRPEPPLNFKLRDIKEQMICSDTMKENPCGCSGTTSLRPALAALAAQSPEPAQEQPRFVWHWSPPDTAIQQGQLCRAQPS